MLVQTHFCDRCGDEITTGEMFITGLIRKTTLEYHAGSTGLMAMLGGETPKKPDSDEIEIDNQIELCRSCAVVVHFAIRKIESGSRRSRA